jgi:hypothetical protein
LAVDTPETSDALQLCFAHIYIVASCTMVRAGVVKHPAESPHSGYLAIQQPPKRYRVADLFALSEL